LQYLTLSVLAVLIVVSIVPFVSSDVIRGESTVPNWVKNTAGWWASDQIPDSAFLQGIQYLVKEGIMIVEIPTEIDSEAAEEVPGWVKNTAGWWAEDKIHDTTFVSGIKYLIGKGILVVMEPQVEEAKCNFKGKEVVCSPFEKEVVEINDFYMEVNSGSCTFCVNWAHVGKEYHIQIETFDERHGKHIDGVKISAKIISNGGELRHDFGQVTTEDGIYKNSITVPSVDWYAENILSVTGEYYGVEKTIEKEFSVFVRNVQNLGVLQVKTLYPINATTHGVNSFTELEGAYGVDTFTIGGSTYAIVAAHQGGGGVQMINLSGLGIPSGIPPFSGIIASDAEADGANGFTELKGARHVAAYTITDATASDLSLTSTNYAIVAAHGDHGVQIIDIGVPTAIVAKDAEANEANGFDQLQGAFGVATFTISSNSTYRGAIVTGTAADSITIIDITNPTAIFEHDVEVDDANSFTELADPRGVDTFTIGSNTYAIIASNPDATGGGVQLVDISDPSNVVAKDAATDGVGGFTHLDGALDVDTFTIGSSTYAIVGSEGDKGVQIIDISDPANIIPLDTATDGENNFDELDNASGVDTFTCGERTYAVVASTADDGVQLIDISDPSNIKAIHSVTDGENGVTELDNTRIVHVATVNGSTYVIATGVNDDGVQILKASCFRQ